MFVNANVWLECLLRHIPLHMFTSHPANKYLCILVVSAGANRLILAGLLHEAGVIRVTSGFKSVLALVNAMFSIQIRCVQSLSIVYISPVKSRSATLTHHTQNSVETPVVKIAALSTSTQMRTCRRVLSHWRRQLLSLFVDTYRAICGQLRSLSRQFHSVCHDNEHRL